MLTKLVCIWHNKNNLQKKTEYKRNGKQKKKGILTILTLKHKNQPTFMTKFSKKQNENEVRKDDTYLHKND